MYPKKRYYNHATQRLFERNISVEEITQALATGKVIEFHPSNDPFPKELILGWAGSRPLHVLVYNNPKEQISYIKTVYEPDLTLWEPDYRTRRLKR